MVQLTSKETFLYMLYLRELVIDDENDDIFFCSFILFSNRFLLSSTVDIHF